MSILSEETLLESRKLFKKNFQSRSSDTCCELDSMSELSGSVYIKSHVILHVKSRAQKVNCEKSTRSLSQKEDNHVPLHLCLLIVDMSSDVM